LALPHPKEPKENESTCIVCLKHIRILRNPRVHSHCNVGEHRRAEKIILSIDGGGGGKRTRVG